MATNIRTLHIEDEHHAASVLAKFLKEYEAKNGGDICFQNVLPGPKWLAVDSIERAFKIIQEHWGRFDLMFLDITIFSDEERREVKNGGVRLLLEIERFALQRGAGKLPFKVIISTAFPEYGQELLQQSDLIRQAVVGYTLKDKMDDTLLPALERFTTAMLERDRPLLDLLQNSTPPKLVMPPRQYDGWGGKTTIVLRPEQILYVKGQQAWHHVHLTTAARKQFDRLLRQEGEAELLRKHPEYNDLRKALSNANKDCKEAEALGGKVLQTAKEAVNTLKNQFLTLKAAALKNQTPSPTDFIRLAGSIGNFMKLAEAAGATKYFHRITPGFVINVQYLACFNASQSEYTLCDNSMVSDIRLIDLPNMA